MSTIAEQLKALIALDTFEGVNQAPMVRANWTKLTWANQTGQIRGEAWQPLSGFAEGEDGAFWATPFAASMVRAGTVFREGNHEKDWIAIWACIQSAAHSGYRLRLEETAVGEEVKWFLEKVSAGVVTVLAEGVLKGVPVGKVGEPVNTLLSFGLTVIDGVVTAWKAEGVGAFAVLGRGIDFSFTSGSIGVEGKGTSASDWHHFYGGEAVIEMTGGPRAPYETQPNPAFTVAGRPDWAPEPELPGQPLYEAAELEPGELKVLGPFYVGDIPAVMIWFKQLSGEGQGRMILRWFKSGNSEKPFVEEPLDYHASLAEIHQVFLCEAPWLTIVIASGAVAVKQTYFVRIQPISRTLRDPRLGNTIFGAIAGVEIGAGKSVSSVIPRTAPGPASLICSCTGEGTTRTAVVEYLNLNGTWSKLFTILLPNSSALEKASLFLARSPHRITVTNNSAGPVTFTYVLGIA